MNILPLNKKIYTIYEYIFERKISVNSNKIYSIEDIWQVISLNGNIIWQGWIEYSPLKKLRYKIIDIGVGKKCYWLKIKIK